MLENNLELNDLSFIGWPDIVALEDTANMLRNFDSAFGSGEFGNEDDFSWSLFPYSEPVLSKHNEEQDGPSKVISTNFSVNESNYSSSVINTIKVQVCNQSEGNMTDQHLENCGSYHDCNIESHQFGYLQNDTPFSQPGIKSQSKGANTLNSSNIEEFSNVCYQVAPIDSYLDMLRNPNSEPETSCLSTRLEETTLEASRLNQLQQVLNQLDIKTKLCLRDGLYRLARSALLRHYSSANCRTEGAEESNELMDIEIETNPIDRSIAHLLFHRSSDLSANCACDGLALESHAIVDRFI